MALNYELLDEGRAEHLRRQRLLDLEADHFRFVLDLDELPPGADPEALMSRLADIERRIVLHREALGLPVMVVTPDDVVSGTS